MIDATKTLLAGICDTMKKCSPFEPIVSTTSKLKLAFVVKDNVFKRPIYMETSSTKTGNAFLLSWKLMINKHNIICIN